MASHAYVDQMTVIELRSLLREHKLPTTGLKAELVDRVRTHGLGRTLQRQKVVPIQPPQRHNPIPPPPQRPSPIPPPPQRPSPIPPPPQRPSPIPPPPQRPSPIPPPPQRPSPIPPPPHRTSQGGPPLTFLQRRKALLRFIETNFPDLVKPELGEARRNLLLNIGQLSLEETADVEYLRDLIKSKRLSMIDWTKGGINPIEGLWVLPDGKIAFHL